MNELDHFVAEAVLEAIRCGAATLCAPQAPAISSLIPGFGWTPSRAYEH